MPIFGDQRTLREDFEMKSKECTRERDYAITKMEREMESFKKRCTEEKDRTIAGVSKECEKQLKNMIKECDQQVCAPLSATLGHSRPLSATRFY
eukprot:1184709-Prorocentrum_minimum.AAC.1